MNSNGRPLIPYLRQSHAKERTISIDEQRRDTTLAVDARFSAVVEAIRPQGRGSSMPSESGWRSVRATARLPKRLWRS
jgi:hypothetical protein